MTEYIIDGREYMEGFVGDPIRFIRELVRCKDCADGHLLTLPDGKKVIECREYLCHEPDWFCADGEKEDAEM